MKIILLTCALSLCIQAVSYSQDFKGQWKGSFLDKSSPNGGWGGDKCDYVLELDVNGQKVSGYSYTYFTDGGKKYYTICTLEGFINRSEKYIEVKEVVRTKTNVPDRIRNCFQVHKLTYFKQGDSETLEGKWFPAPNQEGDCGFGVTSLERRVLVRNTPQFNNSVARNLPARTIKPAIPGSKPKSNPPVAKTVPRVKNSPTLKQSKTMAEEIVTAPSDEKNMGDRIMARKPIFEKRDNSLLKTITVENTSVKVSLYDNGEIDGDSISLFYNGKLILSHQRLSDKAISLNINVEKDQSMNELVMYAENLGSIPPNTALMVVYDGHNRYEVRITSDLQKSGTIRFVLKDNIGN